MADLQEQLSIIYNQSPSYGMYQFKVNTASAYLLCSLVTNSVVPSFSSDELRNEKRTQEEVQICSYMKFEVIAQGSGNPSITLPIENLTPGFGFTLANDGNSNSQITITNTSEIITPGSLLFFQWNGSVWSSINWGIASTTIILKNISGTKFSSTGTPAFGLNATNGQLVVSPTLQEYQNFPPLLNPVYSGYVFINFSGGPPTSLPSSDTPNLAAHFDDGTYFSVINAGSEAMSIYTYSAIEINGIVSTVWTGSGAPPSPSTAILTIPSGFSVTFTFDGTNYCTSGISYLISSQIDAKTITVSAKTSYIELTTGQRNSNVLSFIPSPVDTAISYLGATSYPVYFGEESSTWIVRNTLPISISASMGTKENPNGLPILIPTGSNDFVIGSINGMRWTGNNKDEDGSTSLPDGTISSLTFTDPSGILVFSDDDTNYEKSLSIISSASTEYTIDIKYPTFSAINELGIVFQAMGMCTTIGGGYNVWSSTSNAANHVQQVLGIDDYSNYPNLTGFGFTQYPTNGGLVTPIMFLQNTGGFAGFAEDNATPVAWFFYMIITYPD